MKIGPKYKIAKRLGASVFEKTQTQKFALAEARKSKVFRGRRNVSDYGKQLLEKQKVRMTYGMTERQFRNYVKEATAAQGKSGAEAMHQLLERRLDNVVTRIGLAATRRGARQMVAHGHITVNGKRVKVPSYRVKVGDTISVRAGSKDSALFTTAATRMAEMNVPAWIAVEAKNVSAEIKELPHYTPSEAAGDLSAVLSFYSR